MNNKQFYNIIPKHLSKTNDIKLITKYLIEKNICQEFIDHKYLGNLQKTNKLGELYSKNRLSKIYKKITYSKEVITEFYNFLLTHYKFGLGQNILFNLDFNEDVFGLSLDESKKIASKYFKLYYNKIPIHPSLTLKVDKDRNVIPTPYFESLKKYKETLLNKIEDKSELVIPYLAGNDNYYNRPLFENNEIIKEIFEFENNLKILLELNKKYQFEKVDIFNPTSKSERIYTENINYFDSIKQVQFIENQIYSQKNVNRAFIKCLFDFFRNKLKINTPSGKRFGDVINNYYNFSFGEIKLNGNEGATHEDTIKKIKKEWEIFNS